MHPRRAWRLDFSTTSSMTTLWIWWWLVTQSQGRRYHVVPLAKMQTTHWTHIETCGPVVYVRHQQDGDYHITLSAGTVKVVVEVIPAIPLPVPHKGQTIRVRGISRRDEGHHGWVEIHPAEALTVVPSC